jgi:aryl sulfotransferase
MKLSPPIWGLSPPPLDAHYSFRSHVENMKEKPFTDMLTLDIRKGFNRLVSGSLTDLGTDDLPLASLVYHYTQAKVSQNGGNVHSFTTPISAGI